MSERGPENPNLEIDRKSIDKYKSVIKSQRVFELEGKQRDEAAAEAIRQAGIVGVEDIDDLLNKKNDKNINTEAVIKNIKNFGIAAGECIMESGDKELKQAVIMGSFSTEKKLPTPWQGRGQFEEGDVGLAGVICESFIDGGISNKTKIEIIQRNMEMVDFYKNNPEYSDLLPEQIASSITELRSLINPLNGSEMKIISDRMAYLKKGLDSFNGGGKNNFDDDTVKKIAKATAVEVMDKSRVNRYMNRDEEKSLFNGKYDLEKDGRSWDVSPLYMAIDFKYMNGRMGWRMDTPADWYKKESMEVRDRIDVMVTMNQAAAGLESAGKDLDYVMKNEAAFKFTNENMTQLFNTDFKLVMSKLTNDLCEFYTDVNGHQALRYKEKYYKLFDPKDSKDEYGQDRYGFALDKNGERKIIRDDKSNKGKGARTIDKDVLDKLEHFQNYKDELIIFLAEQNGNEIKTYEENDNQGHKKGEPVLDKNGNPERRLAFMDMMNAYTAWNMVYAMGDTSVWDRMRVLPTYNQIISDAIRTLNPEYKAKGKMMIEKSGKVKKSEALFEAEYFSGQMAEWAIKIMELERDLGEKILDEKGEVTEYKEKSIKKDDKTFRNKVLDRDVELLSNKTFYGLLDFVNGERDLYEGSDPTTRINFYNKRIGKNEKVTLAQLVMNYAYKTDDDGNKTFIPEAERREFNFGDKTTTFQNEFHDMLEGASIMYESMMGKVKDAKVENSGKWAEKIKTAQRMINGIKINDENALLYGRDPNLWRDVIIGTWGCDVSRLSSDHPYLLRLAEKNGFSESYSDYVYDFLVGTTKLNLSNNEVNINELMRLLGVYVNQNENPSSLSVAIRNERIEVKEKRETQRLIRKQRNNSEFDVKTNSMIDMIKDINKITESNSEIDRMKADFMRISKLGRGFHDYAVNLIKGIEREAERQKRKDEKEKMKTEKGL